MAFEQFDAAVRSQIHETLEGLGNTESGVRFVYTPDTGAFQLITPGQFLQAERIIIASSWSDLKHIAPSITELLSNATGKAVFIGNRLSLIPLHFADQFVHGHHVVGRPVITNSFDIHALRKDISKATTALSDRKLPVMSSLVSYTRAADNLIKAIEQGQLESVQYVFGSGHLPKSLTRADYVLNIWGPPASESLNEQLSLLTPGGKLVLMPEYTGSTPSGYFSITHHGFEEAPVATVMQSLQGFK